MIILFLTAASILRPHVLKKTSPESSVDNSQVDELAEDVSIQNNNKNNNKNDNDNGNDSNNITVTPATALLRSDHDNDLDSNNYCNDTTDVGLSEKAKGKQKAMEGSLYSESSKGRENNGKDSASPQKDHTNENDTQGSSSNKDDDVDNNNDIDNNNNNNNDSNNDGDNDNDDNNSDETLDSDLKYNCFSNTTLMEIKVFGDSCHSGVKELAKKHGKSMKQVMMKARFSVHSSRVPNIYNYFHK